MGDKAKNSLKSNIAVAVVVVLVVSFALILVGIDTRNLTTELIKVRSELNTKNRQLGNLSELKRQSIAAKPALVILQGVLPNRDELFSFPREIESLAENHNISSNFSFGGEHEKNIDYTMEVQGSYSAITNFINNIEKEILFMSISKIDFIANENGYSANITGSVFFK